MRRSILCLVILWGTAALGWAEIYRWKDATGQSHFTDNPLAVPQAYRNQIQAPPPESAPDTTSETPPTPPRSAPPLASEGARLRPGAADSEPVGQKIHMLEQQLAAAQQQRQAYIDQIEAERPIRTSPAFGRSRRQVAGLGQALAAVERQIDALQADLKQARAAANTAQEPQSPATSTRDRQSASLETASVWQQRFRTARDRVRQAQEQRQSLLTRLSGDEQRPRTAVGRQGREVIKQTQELQRLRQEIHDAEAALYSLNTEAERSGVPREWRQ